MFVTLLDDILDAFLLLPLALSSFVLLSQLGEDVRLHSFYNSWKRRILDTEEPSGTIGWILQENPAFKNRVFADTQVASNGCHSV